MGPCRSTAAIVVAAGTGSRAGGLVPKQFRLIGGRPMLSWSIDTLKAHSAVSQIIVVVGEDQQETAQAICGEDVQIIRGGATRRDSVRAGLEAMADGGNYDAVLIHDAARPLRSVAVVDRLIAGLASADGAIPVLPVVDTLTRGESRLMGEAVERNALFRVQTPQAFRFDVILAAHRQWDRSIDATDDAGMLRASGSKVALVEGDISLEKITHPEDFERIERQMATGCIPHVGSGFDVHRTEPGRPLFLCGVKLPSPVGLAGHSDADVAIHALVDALLGALAEGDIGQHFPPSDPQWKGASSLRFLEFARDRVSERGGRIAHVDVTIICETPKIGPHRDRLRSSLAELLAISIDKVSVKATTTEGLGYTGRGEGIAAQASATVLMPDQ